MGVFFKAMDTINPDFEDDFDDEEEFEEEIENIKNLRKCKKKDLPF
jgi:hypothetical protein